MARGTLKQLVGANPKEKSRAALPPRINQQQDKESIRHKLLSGVVALQARSGAIQAAIDTLMATMERVGGLSASLASRLEEAEQHVATEIVNREKAGKERALNRTAPIERLDTKKLRQRIVEEDHGKLEVRPTPHPTPPLLTPPRPRVHYYSRRSVYPGVGGQVWEVRVVVRFLKMK